MASNIRAKSIEGHVTDSAGNVLRSAQIRIKQVTPAGSYTLDSVKSDDSGYFISKPIPNGVYDIYESGIRVSRTIHKADENSIQCYKAHRDNYNVLSVESFDYLAGDDIIRMNDFKTFIQIESSETDVPQYGNSFPIYDFEFSSSDPGLSGAGDDLWHLSQFFGLSSDSRITTTRFDTEYYSPLTATSSSYRRMRFSGVAGIRFFEDSKIVVPLDYYSLVLNNPKAIYPASADFGATDIPTTEVDDKTARITNSTANSQFQSLATSIVVGDVLEIDIDESLPYYGIVRKVESTSSIYTITMEKLRSSRYLSTSIFDSAYVKRIFAYDGMFNGISDIDEEANERFTVVENVYTQNSTSEMYSYSGRET